MRSLLFVCAFLLCSTVFAGLTNTRISRVIDLQTNIAQILEEITVKNDGNANEANYELYIDNTLAPHIADVVVSQDSKDLDVKAEKTSKGMKFTATLSKPLTPSSTTTLATFISLTHIFTAHPAQITQQQQQLVIFEANVHSFSPYTTERETVEIRLASSKVESFTKLGDAVANKEKISYGPFTKLAPFSNDQIKIHFANNHPMLTITQLIKEVEVSHWGHLSFEEHVDIEHTGAKLKGGFSRLDFQRNPSQSPSHFRLMAAELPASAHSIYYRDIIGNISTSRVRPETINGKQFTLFEILPRYVMFGGWKTKFYFGYVTPLHEFLGIEPSSGKYSLHVPFGTAIRGAIVDRATVSVILPEGASNIQVSGVQGLTRTDSVRTTYLDTSGRPVITLSKNNLVGDNVATLVVSYSFPATALYFELWLLIGGFFVFFLFCIFFGRFSLKIGKGSDLKETAQELSSKLHSIGKQITHLMDQPTGDAKAIKTEVAALAKEVAEFDSSLKAELNQFSAGVDSVLKEWDAEKSTDSKDVRSKARAARQAAFAELGNKVRDLDAKLSSKL